MQFPVRIELGKLNANVNMFEIILKEEKIEYVTALGPNGVVFEVERVDLQRVKQIQHQWLNAIYNSILAVNNTAHVVSNR